jgi:hypothetical protein
MSVQLLGNLAVNLAGATPLEDVEDFVTEFRITTQRESVSTPATLGTGQADTSAGAESNTLTISFFSDVSAANFWALLYDIITSDTAEMDFEGNFEDGATSANNPKFAGTAVLLSLDSGGTVGQLRQQTITLPIKAGTLVKSTS